MKLKWGALVVDGRNKIGGHVASKNRAGSYLRTKVTPVNPQSNAQQLVRGFVTSLSQAWKGLTADQRGSFNSAVEDYKKTDIFGDIKVPSGFNLFMQLSLNLLGIGKAALDEAPSLVPSEALESITATAVASTSISIAYEDGTATAASEMVFEATAPQSAGKSFLKNQYRRIGQVKGGTVSPYVATSDYATKFGSVPPAGKKIGFRAKCVNSTTGVAGPWVYDTIIV